MQATFCACSRLFIKFGTAMDASSPMMATTIMISTSVKPVRSEVCIFIIFPFLYGGVNEAAGGLLFIIAMGVHELPAANRDRKPTGDLLELVPGHEFLNTTATNRFRPNQNFFIAINRGDAGGCSLRTLASTIG